MITVVMNYRYDPTNLDCEAWVYARSRAEVYYKNHKNRFCGDRSDMDQIAMMAVVEEISKQETKETIPEDRMMAVVDKALSDSIRRSFKQSPIQLEVRTKSSGEEAVNVDNGLIQQPDYIITPEIEEKLRRFNATLAYFLSDEHRSVLWDILALGMTIEERNQKIKDTQVGKGKWVKPTKAKTQRLLDEAIHIVRMKLPKATIEELAKLPNVQERIQ